MPEGALFDGRPCVPDASICGQKGFADAVKAFGHQTATRKMLAMSTIPSRFLILSSSSSRTWSRTKQSTS